MVNVKWILLLAGLAAGCIAVFDRHKGYAPVIGKTCSLETVRNAWPTNGVYEFKHIEWKGDVTNRVFRRIVVDCEGANPGFLLENTASYLEPVMQYHTIDTGNGGELFGVECFCTPENKTVFDNFTREHGIGRLTFEQAKELSPGQVWYVCDEPNMVKNQPPSCNGSGDTHTLLSGISSKPLEYNCVVFNSAKNPQLKVCYTYYHTNLVSVMVHDRREISLIPTESQIPKSDCIDMSSYKYLKRRALYVADVDLWWKTNTLSSAEIKARHYNIIKKVAKQTKSYDPQWDAKVRGLFPSGGTRILHTRWPCSYRHLYYRTGDGSVTMWNDTEDYWAISIEKANVVLLDYETSLDGGKVSVPILGTPPRSLDEFLKKYQDQNISIAAYTADFNKIILTAAGESYLFTSNTLSKILLGGFLHRFGDSESTHICTRWPPYITNEFIGIPSFYNNFDCQVSE
ncbi:MAG: hypothetical protein IJU44_06045 [Kiritimatiellae bacterium]|nr:hypothetical protein [Kiritimatiellia bacterium]